MQNLPVTYAANKKAWMTSVLFRDWLCSVNEDMKTKNRSILLVVDNCPAHPEVPPMSNLTLKFLPPNTTSEVQPMDRGIIKNFKFFYRKLLLRMVITKSIPGISASVIAKSVTVLDAIKWVGEAWNTVKDTTIQNCFKKAGFDLTEQLPTETTEEKITGRITVDDVEYDLEEFVTFDDRVAFTKVKDGNEIRDDVLWESSMMFDDDDLLPLSQLRLKMFASPSSALDDNEPTSVPIIPDVAPNAPIVTQSEAATMLEQISIFARAYVPEMVEHVTICQNLLSNKMA